MFWRNLESDDRCRVSLAGSSTTKHISVLPVETLEYLGVMPNKNFLDLTLGGGGHSEALLEQTAPKGIVVGCDRDAQALERAGRRLSRFGSRCKLIQSELGDVDRVLANPSIPKISGALVDCGISSDQLETADRGFSFIQDGPLDMRMDQTSSKTAASWIQSASEKELADIIWRYGEERNSRRIAKAIYAARKIRRLETTSELSEVVKKAMGAAGRAQKIHPATRTFQAIRIFINQELKQLEDGIQKLLELLPAQARIVVITFHSLEDRIVKQLFRSAAKEGRVRALSKKPVIPTREETRANPRSRSAKLRAVEIMGGEA